MDLESLFLRFSYSFLFSLFLSFSRILSISRNTKCVTDVMPSVAQTVHTEASNGERCEKSNGETTVAPVAWIRTHYNRDEETTNAFRMHSYTSLRISMFPQTLVIPMRERSLSNQFSSPRKRWIIKTNRVSSFFFVVVFYFIVEKDIALGLHLSRVWWHDDIWHSFSGAMCITNKETPFVYKDKRIQLE